jgi:Prokaryotic E2 family E
VTLPILDQQYLLDREIEHHVEIENSMVCVLFPNWQLPPGLSAAETDVLLRLPGGYPDIAPDMWWVSPAIHRADGAVIPATEVTEQCLGRTWQRWSRHFQAGQWQSGIDGLQSFLALIRSEFLIASGSRAA